MTAGRRFGGFRWLGEGDLGVLLTRRPGPAAGGDAPRLARDAAEAREVAAELRVSDAWIEPFFRAGARRAWIVATSPDAREWAGADGGAGARSGLAAFFDAEAVSTLVLFGLAEARLLECRAFLRRHPSYEMIAAIGGFLRSDDERDARAGRFRGPETRWEEPGFAVIRGAGAGTWAAWLAGSLETREGSGASAPALFADALDDLASGDVAARLANARRASALRRSLDHGSRWLVFAPDHPLVLRRAEREARAFIEDLGARGIVAPWGGEGFDVRVERSVDEAGRVRLALRAAVVGRRAIGSLREAPEAPVGTAVVRRSAESGEEAVPGRAPLTEGKEST